jgi:hypothetical protein
LPFVIIALVLTKRKIVRVPLCHHHQGHWSKRTLLILGTLLAAMAAGIGAFAWLTNQQPPNDNAGWLCMACIGLLVVWLVFAAIVQSSSLRPTEITDDTISLARVQSDFKAASREERAGDREERDRYGDQRGDYDDRHPDDEPRRRRPRRDRYDDDDRRRGYDD